jgi:hypothetical protein
MRAQRFEAFARIEAGQSATRVDQSRMQLVTVALTDFGPVIAADGREHTRPEVVCHLPPTEARELAFDLLCLAEHAERPAQRTST